MVVLKYTVKKSIFIYILRVGVGLRNAKECSMSYRQSKMNKLTYFKDLPQQPVSSKMNLQVVGSTRTYILIYLY